MRETRVSPHFSGAIGLFVLIMMVTAQVRAAEDPIEDIMARFDRLKNAFVLARTAAREIPRDTFDPQAVLAETGDNYKRIADWVAANTEWAPYEGALRGPVGVLMDRSGSHLDRALLLADLLTRAGHEVRIERGTLAPAQIEQHVAAQAASTAGTPEQPWDVTDIEEYLAEAARILDLPLERVRRTHIEALTKTEQRIEDLTGQTAVLTPVLARAFGLQDDSPGASGPETGGKAATDHYRVAIKQGRKWISLDPLAGPGKAGTSLFEEAAEVFAAGNLPEDLQHRLTIRVEAERFADGKLTRAVALEHRMNAADLLSEQPSLMLQPLDWPSDLPKMTLNEKQMKALGEQTRSAFLAQREWLPTLALESGDIRQKSFLSSGMIVDKPAISMQSRKISRARTGLDTALGGKKDAGELTGVFVVIEVQAPGREPFSAERAWVDLLGPAKRDAGVTEFKAEEAERNARAIGLGGVMNFLALGSKPSEPWLANQSLGALLENRVPVLGALFAALKGEGDDVSKYLGRSKPSPVELYSLMANRYLGPGSEDLFVSGLNIAASFSRPTLTDGKLGLVQGLDLIRTASGLQPGKQGDARRLRFAQGVNDTVAEALTLPRTEGKRASAAESLARGIAAGQEWVLLEEASKVAGAEIGLDDDARARIARAIAEGKRVLAPPPGSASNEPATWWEFDPQSGAVLGRIAGGEGGAATEEIVLLANDAYSLIMTLKGVLSCRGKGDLEMACCLLQNAVFGGYGLRVGMLFGKAGLNLWGVAFNVAYTSATNEVNLCGG